MFCFSNTISNSVSSLDRIKNHIFYTIKEYLDDHSERRYHIIEEDQDDYSINIKYDTTLIDRDYLRRSRRQSVRPFS